MTRSGLNSSSRMRRNSSKSAVGALPSGITFHNNTGAAAGTGDAKPSGVGLGTNNGTQISKIEARGEVVITSDQDQTTTSDWALYDVPAQLVTVGGNVVLMQGKNVLKGDRLVIDLKTGESRFHCSSGPMHWMR